MREIVVRHVEPADAEALHQMHTHQDVYHDTQQIPHPSMDKWHERVMRKGEYVDAYFMARMKSH